MTILLYFLIIILLVYITKQLKKEHYQNYRKIVISPDQNVYNPPKIYFLNKKLDNYIANKLSQYYPIKQDNSARSNIEIMDAVNNNNNIIGIVSFYDYFNHLLDSRYTNIRFICNIFNNDLTIIGKNNEGFKGKSICIDFNNNGLSYIFNKIRPYLEFELKIINKDINFNDIDNLLNKYDYVAFFTIHPNDKLKSVIQNKYKIIPIYSEIFEDIIPNYNKSFIDSSYYLDINDMIPSISNNIVLICNKHLIKETSYRILDMIYSNFNDFKNTDTNFRKTVQYFNLNNIFAPPIDLIDIHEGIRYFYIDKGYITYQDRNICRKYIGIKQCDPNSLRLNPYRIN